MPQTRSNPSYHAAKLSQVTPPLCEATIHSRSTMDRLNELTITWFGRDRHEHTFRGHVAAVSNDA